MGKWAVGHPGARMHYAVPRILAAEEMLERLFTDFAVTKGSWGLLRPAARLAGSKGLLARIAARLPAGIPAAKVTHWPAFAFECFLRQRRAQSRAELTAFYLWAGREFCLRIIRHGLGRATGVYTFNSAGLELLRYARERGMFCLTEQTIAPAEVEDRLLAEEHARFPEWQEMPAADPYRAEIAARERAEWECADLILCGSEFVRQGIAECGGPAEQCAVVPYGVDLPGATGRRTRGSRLRALVAGGVGLRKGAPYVLAAAKALKRLVEFRWCGGIGVLPEAARRLSEHVDLRGVVPRPLIAEHYEWADLFVLPSICEGSATVCYEALAAGLPVVTTPNAGSVVRDGVDGFIVPIRDAEAIAEKLELLARDRELLAWMSANALARSREFTLERYGERLVAVLESRLWTGPRLGNNVV